MGGTHAEPKLELNPVGVLKQGASVTTAVATGEISKLVTRLYDEVTKDKKPCLNAQRKPTPTRTSTAKVGEAKPEEME